MEYAREFHEPLSYDHTEEVLYYYEHVNIGKISYEKKYDSV